MKKYFILYRPFLVFLAKFFLTYLVLSLVYQGFLYRFSQHSVDAITQFVAANTVQMLKFFGLDFDNQVMPDASFVMLFYKQQPIARMIEGCNAISVIILFVSFVVAFSGKLKATLLFILGGSVLIYILNLVRIALLCLALYHFPEQQELLHTIIFPLFIYGVVFLLWVIWVNKFSLYAK
ncbi:exosortase family protein XrtF [Flavobacterium flavipallidum]|uniref:Exosortase family protein XrtF n=1 Tax=Flavobacterium flavipallidum TaxID=3139140 RepID=A0ABU9HIB5_9FLAO